MAGWFTLAFMVLPVIITASEESLRAVPKGFREASLALGATKWQTIRLNVLPYALPGILTSSVLGIARVAGETAPILFTAAYATSDKLPWEMDTTTLPSGPLGWLEYPFALVASPRLQRRQRVALSHLRRKFQDPAKRVHRARPIRHRLRLPRRGHGHRACFRSPPYSPPQPPQMVKSMSQPPTTMMDESTPTVQTDAAVSSRGIPSSAAPKTAARLNSPTIIDINNVDFYYGQSKALHGINFPIKEKLVTAFIGPSGCGKSTLLRCLNRMNDLVDGTRIGEGGSIKISGVDIYDPSVDVIELRKRVGMVFQKSNPFPKSIYENVVYGLRLQGINEKSRLDETVERSLRGAALWEEVRDRLHTSALGLSGGQQQRLCIARAIAVEPEIILMDEPCSALDPIATVKVEELIHQLKQDYTIVIVTHNMQQAGRCSDVTAFFYMGRLIEMDATGKIFTNPTQKQTEDYISGRFG